MKKELKIGDNEFSIEFNQSEDNKIYELLNSWRKLIEKNDDVWTEIPALPGYIFKNLKIVESTDFEKENCNENSNEISFTLKYDAWNINDGDLMRKKLKEKIIDEICKFGNGKMEFESSDINELINWITELQEKLNIKESEEKL